MLSNLAELKSFQDKKLRILFKEQLLKSHSINYFIVLHIKAFSEIHWGSIRNFLFNLITHLI